MPHPSTPSGPLCTAVVQPAIVIINLSLFQLLDLVGVLMGLRFRAQGFGLGFKSRVQDRVTVRDGASSLGYMSEHAKPGQWVCLEPCKKSRVETALAHNASVRSQSPA